MITEISVESAVQIERQFAANHYTGSLNLPPLLVIPGTIPIVLSCPHAVAHPRGDRLKLAEPFTGALTTQLAALTSAHALIYARTSAEDANYDADGPYKRRLIELVRESGAVLVIDLHGMSSVDDIQLAIGTNHGKTLGQRADLLPAFLQPLKDAGFANIALNPPAFAATGCNTIASFISREAQVAAMQLEIHIVYRYPIRRADEYVKMLHALAGAVSAVISLV